MQKEHGRWWLDLGVIPVASAGPYFRVDLTSSNGSFPLLRRYSITIIDPFKTLWTTWDRSIGQLGNTVATLV